MNSTFLSRTEIERREKKSENFSITRDKNKYMMCCVYGISSFGRQNSRKFVIRMCHESKCDTELFEFF